MYFKAENIYLLFTIPLDFFCSLRLKQSVENHKKKVGTVPMTCVAQGWEVGPLAGGLNHCVCKGKAGVEDQK